MTRPLTAEEAGDVLSPHLAHLGQSLDHAWKRWRALVDAHTELAFIVSNRTRASLVYDFIRHEALTAFHGTPGVHLSEDRSFLRLTFDEKIVLRFKKFRDQSLATSGASTRQAQDWANQVLPGMEALTHLVAGYLPDALGLTLKKTAITCTDGSDLLWVIDLDLDLGDTAAPAPVTPLPTAPPQPGTIIRPRRPDDAQDAPGQAASEER